jgi:hypothetical protein
VFRQLIWKKGIVLDSGSAFSGRAKTKYLWNDVKSWTRLDLSGMPESALTTSWDRDKKSLVACIRARNQRIRIFSLGYPPDLQDSSMLNVLQQPFDSIGLGASTYKLQKMPGAQRSRFGWNRPPSRAPCSMS